MAQGTVIITIESDSNGTKTAEIFSNFLKCCTIKNLPYSTLHNKDMPIKYKNILIDRLTINTSKITI